MEKHTFIDLLKSLKNKRMLMVLMFGFNYSLLQLEDGAADRGAIGGVCGTEGGESFI